jgi:prepilin-type N-terminal cleavage/methylation domain-containing protein
MKLLKKNNTKKGFSIPELIIVVAIFAVITTIAMFDQGRLSSNVLLTNMSYEVALAIREAQVYGLGVRNTGANDGSEFQGEYGAHFDINSPREVFLFGNNYVISDNPGFDPGEELFQYTFENQRGNLITAICVGDINTANGERCTAEESNPFKVNEVDIVFKRPNPSPRIISNTGAGTTQVVGRVYIVLNNVDGNSCRTVIVEGTGQIRVEDGLKTNPVCTNTN